MALMWF